MKVSWHDLQDTPAYVIEDYRIVMEAEATAQREADRKMQQRSKQ